MKRYVRCIADWRLTPLSLQPIYRSDAKNPLPWMDQMLNAIEHTNFLREPRHGILEGVDARHLGRGVRLGRRLEGQHAPPHGAAAQQGRALAVMNCLQSVVSGQGAGLRGRDVEHAAARRHRTVPQ